MRSLLTISLAWVVPLLAQGTQPVGPSDEIIGPGKGETIRMAFGGYAGGMYAPRLIDGFGGGGGAAMTIGSFWEPASIAITAGAYAGAGNMGAMLDFSARQRFFRSRGRAFDAYGGFGFGVHMTPQFFSEGYDMSGIYAGVFLDMGAHREITEEVSLWLQAEYGIINSSGTPNYLQVTAGVMIFGR
ncbi:MAG: hypothetical protein ACP5QG_05935 [candidate division WOR-3 bacterium]